MHTPWLTINLTYLYLALFGIIGGCIIVIAKADNFLNRRRALRWLAQVQSGKIQPNDNDLRMYRHIASRTISPFSDIETINKLLLQHPYTSPNYRVLYQSVYAPGKLFFYVECSYKDFVLTGTSYDDFDHTRSRENRFRDVKKKEYHYIGLEFDPGKNELRAVTTLTDTPEQRGLLDRFGMALLEKVAEMNA